MVSKVDIPPHQTSRKDYEAVATDFQIIELLDGDILMTPPPTIPHQRLVQDLYYRVRHYFQSNPLGEVFLAPTGILIPSGDVVEPDLFIILNEKKEIIGDQYITGPPNIIVEIQSPSTQHRDWGRKFRLYEEFGVEEYWIIHPDTLQASVFKRRRESSEFDIREDLDMKKAKISTNLLPGFVYPVD